MAQRDAREAIIRTAERMIADQGVNVALRDIAVAAGQRNNSAVQYHFGSRDGLIQAVAERPLDASETRRLKMLAQHEASGASDSLETLVRIFVMPTFLAIGTDQGTHAARFLERVRDHPAVARQFERSDHFSMFIVTTRLERLLGHLGESERRRRLRSLATVLFSLAADDERERETGADVVAAEVAARQIVQMLVGLLGAPAAAPSG